MRRAAVGLALALVLGAPGVTAPEAVATSASAATVRIEFLSLTPILGPGDGFEAEVRIENTGLTPVAEPRVTLYLNRSGFISRYSLDLWRNAAPDSYLGEALARRDLSEPLAPGAATTVSFRVPATAVGLPDRATSWGARGVAVRVADRDDPYPGLGVARTFTIWYPEQDVTATRVSVLIPVTGSAVDPRNWVSDLEALTSPGGRLHRLLRSTGDLPEISWAVDPWLLEAPAAGSSVLQSWTEQLISATADREVTLLPYLDPDVSALAHADARAIYTTSLERAESAARNGGLSESAQVSLAWPAVALPDLATAAFVASDIPRTLVVAPGELPAPTVLTYTPTGKTSIATAARDVPILIPDERLSAALLTGRVGPIGEPARPDTTPVTAAQDLLAELAVITRERPTTPRHMLLTVPRDWSPEVPIASAQLQALTQAPWVRLEPVSALVGTPDPAVERGGLPAQDVHDSEISAAELRRLQEAIAGRAAFSSILENPAAVTGDLDRELLAPTSVAWRTAPADRADLIAAAAAATAELRDAVAVEPGGAVNLASSSGGLPVEVTNTLDQEVSIRVRLRPQSARLAAAETVSVTVPAADRAVVQVPVHAVQSGDVRVTVELLTPDGMLLDDSTEFVVRVRAEWEGIGSAIGAGLLALLLAIGIVRTIRRGRSARRSRPEPGLGPDDLSPELVGPSRESER